MSRLYKRSYVLTISPEPTVLKIIRELKVNFEITKSILNYPNLCKLDIFNPNENTISFLKTKYSRITLEAGYEGSLKLIFKGQVRNVFITKTPTDRIVTIYAGDGEQDWQNSTFNKSFTESVPVNAVVNEVLKSFKNLSVGEISGLPDAATKLRGQVLSGGSKDILNDLAKEYGFNWSIQNEEIIIVPNGLALSNFDAVLLTSKTGMLNSPTVTEQGVEVTSLLNPDISPNRLVKIASLGAEVTISNLFIRNVTRTSGEGTYIVQEVTHRGDSREGNWISQIKGLTTNVQL